MINITIGNTTTNNITNTLPQLIQHLEQQHGPLHTLTPQQQQHIIQTLINHGAHALRGFVQTLHQHTGRSRTWIYQTINNHQTPTNTANTLTTDTPQAANTAAP